MPADDNARDASALTSINVVVFPDLFCALLSKSRGVTIAQVKT
jgi:hypothetical protein